MNLPENSHIFALVDCNNFYASCERVFNPQIHNKPVVVLSNNDGCAIARSAEAKILGIKMGAPYFEWQHLVKPHNIRVYSANFVLYGDMSARVMRTLEMFAPEIEIYSIDEAFLKLDTLPVHDFKVYATEIYQQVKQQTGLPVSIGIASTKTLAKAANYFGKRVPELKGVTDFVTDPSVVDGFLKQLPVREIWGIGQKRAEFLQKYGILTAYDLKGLDDKWIDDNLTIMGLRTVWELRGTSCLQIEEDEKKRQTIASTRSFGKEIKSFDELLEALSYLISIAAQKLRGQSSKTGYMQVFVASNPFKKGLQYRNAAGVVLDPKTDDSAVLLGYCRKILEQIYSPDFTYKRAGVIMSEFVNHDEYQYDLCHDGGALDRRSSLMSIIDRYNRTVNSGEIKFAQEGVRRQNWFMNQNKKSSRYTTNWNELLTIKI
ncbi:MAG: Y-family DNA polymerase [Candidatus Omnitrophica bacterium]|nr:Y-family DNA polymerase [Candidatus Omnitrophota bacterium]